MHFSLAHTPTTCILPLRPRSMLIATAQLVAFAAGVCVPSQAPASDFVAVDLSPDPDLIVPFDTLHPWSPGPGGGLATLVGNYTRGIDLDSPNSGYLIHTAQLFGTPTGLYRFNQGVTTLIAQLPITSPGDCGFTLTADASTIFYSVAQDRASDLLVRGSVTGNFVTIGQITRADSVLTDIIGLAMSDQGILFALDTTDDSLLRINPETGAATKVGPFGVPVGGEGELDFDPITGQLFMAAGYISSRIYAVNTTTGAATLSGDLPFVTSAIAFAGTMTTCPMDLDNGSGLGTHDGAVNIDDLLFFLSKFETGSPAADLDNGTSTGTPNGAVEIDDLLFFLVNFENGC